MTVRGDSLGDAAWWTDADEAELAVLANELVRLAFDHRDLCEVCQARFPPCRYVGEAITDVLDWRAARILRSKAVWLRARQDEAERIAEETTTYAGEIRQGGARP